MKHKRRFLYILVSQDGGLCKIGISIDPLQRSILLNQSFHYEKSIMVDFPFKTAISTEKFLHSLLSKFSVTMEKMDGYTEWFKIDAMKLAIDFVDMYRKPLKAGEWTMFDVSKINVRPNKTARLISFGKLDEHLTMRFLPYCVKRLDNGRFILLNRHYKPIGMMNTSKWIKYEDDYGTFEFKCDPIKDKAVCFLRVNDHSGFFYDDSCPPHWVEDHATAYFERLRLFGSLPVKDE